MDSAEQKLNKIIDPIIDQCAYELAINFRESLRKLLKDNGMSDEAVAKCFHEIAQIKVYPCSSIQMEAMYGSRD